MNGLDHKQELGCVADDGEKRTCRSCNHGFDSRGCLFYRCMSMARRVMVFYHKAAAGEWKISSIHRNPRGNPRGEITIIPGMGVWSGEKYSAADRYRWDWDGREWVALPVKPVAGE